jgi:tRNA pseudouridine13 synthase
MYVVKHVPEDFVVEEVSTVKPKSSGSFVYFKMWKKGVSTLDALHYIAHDLHVPAKDVSCAGNKDKIAVTEQVCSARTTKDRLEKLSYQKIKLDFLGFGDEPVHLGDLEGNKFKIIVRNIDNLPKISPKFRNLFGEQRFSTKNVEIGRHIVKREFEKAALLIAKVHAHEKIKPHLSQRDWVGALRCLPRKLLLLFVHAYQSYLWNKAAMLSAEQSLPIVGFGTEIKDDITKQILAGEALKPSDFVIRELPEVSAEGSGRAVWADARDLKAGGLEDDEFFPGKKKVLLEFFLPRGCYATEFIRQQFRQ